MNTNQNSTAPQSSHPLDDDFHGHGCQCIDCREERARRG